MPWIIHVDNGKLEPRDVKCIFLGYGSGVKAYKLWNPETKRIFMSRNVVFNEAVMFTDSQTSTDSDVSDVSDDEQQRTSMQVEHIEEKGNNIAENNDVDHEPEFDDTDNHFVPPSTSRKRAFGQEPLVPASIWAGTKGPATSPEIRQPPGRL
jgi:hypothetical protein